MLVIAIASYIPSCQYKCQYKFINFPPANLYTTNSIISESWKLTITTSTLSVCHSISIVSCQRSIVATSQPRQLMNNKLLLWPEIHQFLSVTFEARGKVILAKIFIAWSLERKIHSPERCESHCLVTIWHTTKNYHYRIHLGVLCNHKLCSQK